MIRIVSRKDGFCRCGVKHPAAPTDYPDNFFTPQQMERLKAEPMLIVQELDIPFGQKGEAAADVPSEQESTPVIDEAAEQGDPAVQDKQLGKSKKGK